MSHAKSWMKPASDAHSVSAYGKQSEGYAERKDVYESDAKALAGKERRELAALFGKGSGGATTTSQARKYEPSSSSAAAVPSMFRGGGPATGTLMSAGSSSTMDASREKIVTESNRGAFGGRATGGTVSRLNMGSAGVMDTSSNRPVTEANRAQFAARSSSPASSGAGKPGAPKTVPRGPDSSHGVLRKFAWE